MVKNSIKQIFRWLFKIVKIIPNLILFAFLFLWFVYDSVIVFLAPADVLVIYSGMMIGSLLSLFGTMFPKIRKKAYIGFLIFFCGYLGMFFYAPPIVEQHNADKCLDSGRGVWDYAEHRCRTDCLTWNKEQGCVRE